MVASRKKEFAMFRCVGLILCLLCAIAVAQPGYEAPQWRADNVLPPPEQSGALFRVIDPVTTDGLMPHYLLETTFGPMHAYSHAELVDRLREIQALEVATSTSDWDVVADTTKRRVEGTFKTVADAARDPIGLVQGLPRGVINLFRGTAAQARELGREAQKATDRSASKSPSSTAAPQRTEQRAEHAAARYADHYLGLSADERAWYQRLGVDPYNDNEALRRVVHHLAQVEAATSLGLRLASLPSVPYAGDLQHVMDAVYREDPAILRERRRQTLIGYGVTPDEVDRFESTLALSPTRQLRLVTATALLEGVAGRDVFFRQSAQLASADEAEIYVASVEHLSRVHARRPLSQIIASLRMPGALYADGSGAVVVAAVEGVYWTALVDTAERALTAGLPAASPHPELWVTGFVSDEARSQLTHRGWIIRDYAFDPGL
jgi:hypothetical protein